MNQPEIEKTAKAKIIITIAVSDDLTSTEKGLINKKILERLRQLLHKLPFQAYKFFSRPIVEIVPLPMVKPF